MHRGRSFIIQIELCRPIDTFSGGGFSNCRHRGSSTRARRRESAGEFAYGIELFHSPTLPRSKNSVEGEEGGKGTELFLSGALTVPRTGWKIIGRLLRPLCVVFLTCFVFFSRMMGVDFRESEETGIGGGYFFLSVFI